MVGGRVTCSRAGQGPEGAGGKGTADTAAPDTATRGWEDGATHSYDGQGNVQCRGGGPSLARPPVRGQSRRGRVGRGQTPGRETRTPGRGRGCRYTASWRWEGHRGGGGCGGRSGRGRGGVAGCSPDPPGHKGGGVPPRRSGVARSHRLWSQWGPRAPHPACTPKCCCGATRAARPATAGRQERLACCPENNKQKNRRSLSSANERRSSKKYSCTEWNVRAGLCALALAPATTLKILMPAAPRRLCHPPPPHPSAAPWPRHRPPPGSRHRRSRSSTHRPMRLPWMACSVPRRASHRGLRASQQAGEARLPTSRASSSRHSCASWVDLSTALLVCRAASPPRECDARHRGYMPPDTLLGVGKGVDPNGEGGRLLPHPGGAHHYMSAQGHPARGGSSRCILVGCTTI